MRGQPLALAVSLLAMRAMKCCTRLPYDTMTLKQMLMQYRCCTCAPSQQQRIIRGLPTCVGSGDLARVRVGPADAGEGLERLQRCLAAAGGRRQLVNHQLHLCVPRDASAYGLIMPGVSLCSRLLETIITYHIFMKELVPHHSMTKLTAN